MPEKRGLILWIILIVLIIFGFIIYTISRTRTPEEQPEKVPETPTTEVETENLTNIDPATVDSQLKGNLDLATSLAKKWYSDVKLVYVQIKLSSITPDEGTETYVFDSPSHKKDHFTFTISQKSENYIRAVIPTEDYLGTNLTPIALKYWKLNYVQALQTAETEGGKEFREEYLNWNIELSLSHREPKGWLYWVVEYKTKEGESLSVKINPDSGEVVKETET